MKKEKTVMKQSDSTSRVTPYELATLASRIYSELCATDPKEAIAAAERLVSEARNAIARAEAEERKDKEKWAEYDKWLETRVDWVRGIKDITSEHRRDRATRRFAEFMEHDAPREDLSDYKRDGFTVFEVMLFEYEFRNWREQSKRKKGKQGRRISQHDGRLRTELVGLAPRKPSKPS
jgi:hypothetical protein